VAQSPVRPPKTWDAAFHLCEALTDSSDLKFGARGRRVRDLASLPGSTLLRGTPKLWLRGCNRASMFWSVPRLAVGIVLSCGFRSTIWENLPRIVGGGAARKPPSSWWRPPASTSPVPGEVIVPARDAYHMPPHQSADRKSHSPRDSRWETCCHWPFPTRHDTCTVPREHQVEHTSLFHPLSMGIMATILGSFAMLWCGGVDNFSTQITVRDVR